MMLVLVSHIEGSACSTPVAPASPASSTTTGAWAGKLFLVVEEGWALTASPGRGRVAERVRAPLPPLRAVADLHQPALQGPRQRAGPRAAWATACCGCACRTTATTSSYGRDTIGLTDTDIEQITTLPKQEGLYSTVYVVSRRGRGAVRSRARATSSTGSARSDPEHDQPRRAQALKDAGGDPWEALRLLCTPEWHDTYRDRYPTA